MIESHSLLIRIASYLLHYLRSEQIVRTLWQMILASTWFHCVSQQMGELCHWCKPSPNWWEERRRDKWRCIEFLIWRCIEFLIGIEEVVACINYKEVVGCKTKQCVVVSTYTCRRMVCNWIYVRTSSEDELQSSNFSRELHPTAVIPKLAIWLLK